MPPCPVLSGEDTLNEGMMSLVSFSPLGSDWGIASIRPASNPKVLAACFSGGRHCSFIYSTTIYISFLSYFWTSYLAHYWKLFKYQEDNEERKDFFPMNKIQALVQILYPMTTNHAVVTCQLSNECCCLKWHLRNLFHVLFLVTLLDNPFEKKSSLAPFNSHKTCSAKHFDTCCN